ncbi:unnamed protein product [Gulo gulo]|uniref:Uncharacterized protein n=1 Tax=Gulo gulo TaxID=48420 RepID=A0A9X9Q4S7_GULGU|nr:unnamed protein product [Gulo gulo]
MWFLRALLRSRRAHHSSSPGLFCPQAPRGPAQLTVARCRPPRLHPKNKENSLWSRSRYQ